MAKVALLTTKPCAEHAAEMTQEGAGDVGARVKQCDRKKAHLILIQLRSACHHPSFPHHTRLALLILKRHHDCELRYKSDRGK
jgi:hypothetical protein